MRRTLPSDSPFINQRFLTPYLTLESNASSGDPGEVPDDEVNAHLGNPGVEEFANGLSA